MRPPSTRLFDRIVDLRLTSKSNKRKKPMRHSRNFGVDLEEFLFWSLACIAIILVIIDLDKLSSHW